MDNSGYEGDPIHLDEIAIPGAKIEDLHQAFKAEYSNIRAPIDMILAAGLNNFQQEVNTVIMSKIRSFKQTVVRREDGSTFSVCTLPLAPRLTDIIPK